MPLTAEQLRALITPHINERICNELNEEGFPDYMIQSFLLAARETKTVVSCRLPGGVGVDLIENGCDLKGFHIKAKSCNWGPMAGFICQLPPLNKFGYGKIDYNASNIAHYLYHVDHFAGSKTTINGINDRRRVNIAAIDASTDLEPQKKLSRAEVNRTCDRDILAEIKRYQEVEQTSGEWSGENTLPASGPFIHLKRKLSVLGSEVRTRLASVNGIIPESLVLLDVRTIYGIAVNDSYSNTPRDNKATVLIEFLLVQEGSTNVWQFYHGEIKYKADATATGDYTTYNPRSWSTLTSVKTREKYPEETNILQRIFSFPAEGSITRSAPGYANMNFAAATTPKPFYPIRGFINAHPPYREDSPDFYKNAVSGDYDLFAFWPNISSIGINELIRKSEAKIGKQLRMGGKILTTYIGDKSDLAVEFIPGFTELDPAKEGGRIRPGEELKESAELGNISSLGELVQGTVNSFATSLGKDVYSWTVSPNKAFHSDEGGRPGIMEIEFPIAFFFPYSLATKALNNRYTTGKTIPPFDGREYITISGGLIKTVEELLQLILECQNFIGNDITKRSRSLKDFFLVLMHCEWMMHLFFVSLDTAMQDAFLRGTTPYDANIFAPLRSPGGIPLTGEALEKVNKMIADKIGEFNKIKDHLNPGFSQPAFEASLKKLLLAQSRGVGSANDSATINNNYFDEMRTAFLRMAFQPDRKAYAKRMEIEAIMRKYHRIYPNYLIG